MQYKAGPKIYNLLSCCSKSPSHFYLDCCYPTFPTNGRLKFEAYFWALVKVNFTGKWSICKVSSLVAPLHYTELSKLCVDFLLTFPGANTTKAMRRKCKNQNFQTTFCLHFPKLERSPSPRATGQRSPWKCFNSENFIQQHLNNKPHPQRQGHRPNNYRIICSMAGCSTNSRLNLGFFRGRIEI